MVGSDDVVLVEVLVVVLEVVVLVLFLGSVFCRLVIVFLMLVVGVDTGAEVFFVVVVVFCCVVCCFFLMSVIGLGFGFHGSGIIVHPPFFLYNHQG